MNTVKTDPGSARFDITIFFYKISEKNVETKGKPRDAFQRSVYPTSGINFSICLNIFRKQNLVLDFGPGFQVLSRVLFLSRNPNRNKMA